MPGLYYRINKNLPRSCRSSLSLMTVSTTFSLVLGIWFVKVFSFRQGMWSHTLLGDDSKSPSLINSSRHFSPLAAKLMISSFAASGITVEEAIHSSSVLLLKTFSPQWWSRLFYLVGRLGTRESKALIGLHYFTGSDWEGKMNGIGKATLIKKLLSPSDDDPILTSIIKLGKGDITKFLIDDQLPADVRQHALLIVTYLSPQTTFKLLGGIYVALKTLKGKTFPQPELLSCPI